MSTAITNPGFFSSLRPPRQISDRYPVGVSALGANVSRFPERAKELVQQHVARVNADGETVPNEAWVETIILLALRGGYFDRLWCFYDLDFGYKSVTENGTEFITKFYSIHGADNDAVASGSDRPRLETRDGKLVATHIPESNNQATTAKDDRESFGGNKTYICGLFLEDGVFQGFMGSAQGNTRGFWHDGAFNRIRFRAGNNTVGEGLTTHEYDPESEEVITFDDVRLVANLWGFDHVRNIYADKIPLEAKLGDGEAWMNRVGFCGEEPGNGNYLMYCRAMKDIGFSAYSALVDAYANKGEPDDPEPDPEPGDSVGTISFDANTTDDGDFKDHGIGVAVPFLRGLVSSANGLNEDVVLMLFGSTSFMEVNIDTEAYEEHFYGPTGGIPYASLLASDWVYYTMAGGKILFFDTDSRVLSEKTLPTSVNTYSFFEDGSGIIWGVGNDDIDGVSAWAYDPVTDTVTDYGAIVDVGSGSIPKVYEFAGDNDGWIYFALGGGIDRIYGFKDGEGTATDLGDAGADKRAFHRGQDGKVYHDRDGTWIELFQGVATALGGSPGTSFKPRGGFAKVTGTHSLTDRDLRMSDRRIWENLDFRHLSVIDDATGEVTKNVRFNTTSGEGSIAGVLATDVSTIAGATVYPWRWWFYDPATDQWTVGTQDMRQWNTATKLDNGQIFLGCYPGRGFTRWDPSATYTGPGFDTDDNPRWLTDNDSGRPEVWRNTCIAGSLPDNRYVVTGGYSEKEHPAGGLMVWDRTDQALEIILGSELFSGHNNHSLVPLSNNRFLVGTTVYQWGGTETESVAKLYIIDIETKAIEWQGTPVADARTYFDMHLSAANGFVYICVTNTRQGDPRLFKFDLDTKAATEIAIPVSLDADVVRDNGPRVFVETPDDRLFMLFYHGIAEIDLPNDTLHKWADNPTGSDHIRKGGDYLDGRIYFCDDRQHLWSWAVPAGGVP